MLEADINDKSVYVNIACVFKVVFNDKSVYVNIVRVFNVVCLHLTLMTNLCVLILRVFFMLFVFV